MCINCGINFNDYEVKGHIVLLGDKYDDLLNCLLLCNCRIAIMTVRAEVGRKKALEV